MPSARKTHQSDSQSGDYSVLHPDTPKNLQESDALWERRDRLEEQREERRLNRGNK